MAHDIEATSSSPAADGRTSPPGLGRRIGDFAAATVGVLLKNPLSTPLEAAASGLWAASALAFVGCIGAAVTGGVMLGVMGAAAAPAVAPALFFGGLLGGAVAGVATTTTLPLVQPLAIAILGKYAASYSDLKSARAEDAKNTAGQRENLAVRMAVESGAAVLDGLDLKAAFAASAPRGVANDAPAAAPAAAQPAAQSAPRNGM
jgi:hypothetical protein